MLYICFYMKVYIQLNILIYIYTIDCTDDGIIDVIIAVQFQFNGTGWKFFRIKRQISPRICNHFPFNYKPFAR